MVLKNNKVTPINNFDFNGENIFTIEIDNKVWFYGKQVASLLNYVRPVKALKEHIKPKHRKTLKQSESPKLGLSNLWSGSDHQPKTLIDISGVYSLVLRSTLPQAEQFQDWVTDEVLPSIQRTGGYKVEEHKPLTLDEQLSIISQASLETRQTVKQNTTDIKQLKDTFPISNSQQAELNQLEHALVIEFLGGKESNAYEQLKGKAFAQCWRDFKRHFNLPRYNELPKVKFEQGKQYLKLWAPDTDLRIAIKKANNQLSMM